MCSILDEEDFTFLKSLVIWDRLQSLEISVRFF